jgi:hypothetical protein
MANHRWYGITKGEFVQVTGVRWFPLGQGCAWIIWISQFDANRSSASCYSKQLIIKNTFKNKEFN